jgi:hypothetical protein
MDGMHKKVGLQAAHQYPGANDIKSLEASSFPIPQLVSL